MPEERITTQQARDYNIWHAIAQSAWNGLGLSLLILILHTLHTSLNYNLNAAWSTTAWSLIICPAWFVIFGWLGKEQHQRIIVELAGSLLGACVASSLCVLLGTKYFLADYYSAPALKQFAVTEFSQVDTNKTGVITSQQLDKILSDQAAIEHVIDDIDTLKEDSAKANITTKTLTESNQMLAQLEARFLANHLTDQERKLIAIAHSAIPIAGHRITAKSRDAQEEVWGATREELASYREKLLHDYPLYVQLLQAFHKI